MTDPRGFVTNYEYDDLGNLVTIIQPDADGVDDPGAGHVIARPSAAVMALLPK